MRIWLNRIWQIGLLNLLSLGMNFISNRLDLPIPGSILGIAVLFLLLRTGVIRLKWVESGAGWLLAELLLFFIPSTVGIVQYAGVLKTDGFSIAVTVVVSTIIVMASTGYAAQRIARRKEGQAR